MLLMLLYGGLNLYGGAPISILYGSNLTGSIDYKGEVDTFTFTGYKNDIILIRMRDEQQVDAHIQLFDPNGIQISSDWSDGGLAEIRNLHLDEDGMYTLIAFDNNHNDLGYYGLSLNSLNFSGYETAIPAFISLENEVSKNAEVDMYTFSGQKNDVLFAELRAEFSDFENEFIIYDSDGKEIFQSTKQGRRAVVGPVSLTKDDAYKIAILDNGGNDKGTYGFTLNMLNRHDQLEATSCDESMSLSLDKLVERKVFKINSNENIIHLLESKSNDTKLELAMEIYDEFGKQIFQDIKSNKLIHSMMNDAKYQTSYLVVLYDEHGNDKGDFGLQIHNIEDNGCTSIISCQNTSEEIGINHLAKSKVYMIEGYAQNPVNVSLEDMETDNEPQLRIYTKSGNMFAEDHGEEKADLSDFVFPYDDEFILVASDFSGNDLGNLSLEYISSDMEMELDDCHIVYDGYDPMSTTTLTVNTSENNLEYAWSNGENTQSITVSPSTDTDYFVTVTNIDGCYEIMSTFVEVQDVTCGNGNNIKVQVCHVKNNGTLQQLCISENGVMQHLENGQGHIGCYIGECGYVNICEEEITTSDPENNLKFGESIDVRGDSITEVKSNVFPNPTSNQFRIKTNKNAYIQEVNIFNTNGVLMQQLSYSGSMQEIEFRMEDYGLHKGLYIIQLRTTEKTEIHRLLYL